METKFYTETFELELGKQKLNLQENNSRFNDKSFTKFTFPFEVNIEERFIHAIGDFQSKDSTGLSNIINGFFLHENKISEAKLTILSIQGAKLVGQIDFGFEDIPNFDKKLSELPLAKFNVDDIHTYAKQICGKKWPEVNFNFPRMYSDKYSPDNEIWDAFDGYYNDLKPDGSEMRRNYIDEDLNIFNVNIIHPCPHPIYILQAGFGDKGLKLKGDILTDPDLLQRWVFSGTEYFSTKSQARYGFFFTSGNFDSLDLENGPDDYARYDKEIVIEKTGKYSIRGEVQFWKARKMAANYWIAVNNVLIWHKYDDIKSSVFEQIRLDISFNINTPNSKIRFYIYTQYHEDSWTHQISNLTIASDTLEDLQSLEEDSNVVTNKNEIDLTRAVPEMTFGDYVNRIKNWLNYEIDVVGKDVYMNKLNKDPENIKSFQQYEKTEPKRTLLNQRSYLIKFADLDNDVKQNSMYYDASGVKINGEPKTDTTTIEIDGYAMPVELAKPGGYTTAIVKKDSSSTLALVGYDGLTDNQNNAKNPPGLAFPELWEKNWYKHLRQRLYGSKYEDSFLAYVEDISQFSIKNYIYWHNNVHQISSWGKEMVTPDVYKINITTETIV